ncbi:MAG: tetratricopeptide repeat protein [Nitrospiraceae bacterium]
MPSTSEPAPSSSARLERLAAEWTNNPHSKVFVQLAEEYVKAGQSQKAVVVLQEGLLVYPGYVIAMVVLGSIYQQVGEDAKAKAVLEDAVVLSPENLKAHRLLAKLYAAEGNTESARKSCTVVLMTNPLDEEINVIERSLPRIKKVPPPDPSVTALAGIIAEGSGSIHQAPSTAQSIKSRDQENETNISTAAAPIVTHPDELDTSSDSEFAPTMTSVIAKTKRVARLQNWLTGVRARRRTRA